MEINHKYKEAIAYKNKAEYILSWEIFRLILKEEAVQSSAQILFEASEVLKALDRVAHAGMYLTRAKQLCRIEDSAENFFLLAKINVHLGIDKGVLFYIKKAIDLDINYQQKAKKEKLFEYLYEHPKFIILTQSYHKPSKAIILDLLLEKKWEKINPEQGMIKTMEYQPQFIVLYKFNPVVNFIIAYYEEEALIYLKLRNAEDLEDEQAYKFYMNKNLLTFLTTLVNFQDKMNINNWEDFLEDMIPHCKEVSFEMPDGRLVKIS